MSASAALIEGKVMVQALAEYQESNARSDASRDVPERPLLYVPSHPAREMEKDLKAARQAIFGG